MLSAAAAATGAAAVTRCSQALRVAVLRWTDVALAIAWIFALHVDRPPVGCGCSAGALAPWPDSSRGSLPQMHRAIGSPRTDRTRCVGRYSSPTWRGHP